MGTICILLGLIIFCIFTLGGCFAATRIVEMYTRMFALPNQNMVIGLIIAVFAMVGFLICLSLVMHGLTYNKVSKLYRLINAKKRGKKDI